MAANACSLRSLFRPNIITLGSVVRRPRAAYTSSLPTA